MRTLKITRNDAGQRLDKFLAKTLSELPASLMYKYIRTKKIKVNNARCEQGHILGEGDEVQLYIKDEFFASPERDAATLGAIRPRLSIIYEDGNIMLLNKRPGVLVHEDAGGNTNTLIMHILAYLYQKGEYDPSSEQSFAPALCNRIDRNTGGIVIAAKNAAALREMNERIRLGEVGKFYICAVHGGPPRPAGTLHGWLRKDSERNIVSVSDTKMPGGREIISKYRVIASRGGDSLLEVELITGRTHQIRAQLSHVGCPLLGEGKYAKNREDKKKGYKHQALYAWRVRFNFAKDYEGILKYLRGREFSLPEEEIWFLKDFS